MRKVGQMNGILNVCDTREIHGIELQVEKQERVHVLLLRDFKGK